MILTYYARPYCKLVGVVFVVPEPANVGAEGVSYDDTLEAKTCVATTKNSENTDVVDSHKITESEPSYDITTHRPNWPEYGGVETRNLWAFYRSDLPPILRDVSFIIKPGSRVGVVGRTGAGKSTLVSTILRLVDTTKGDILIDGLPIQKVGLHDLRPRISVIPQTPFLFSGTLRKNLDPFDVYEDKQIWDALDATGLRGVVGRLSPMQTETSNATAPVTRTSVQDARSVTLSPSSSNMPTQQEKQLKKETAVGNLLGYVEEGGSNFSTGERQLVCLARAILQRNRILIMDEATANIDLETDKKVQKAIREHFSNQGTTVITIAHRLHTVIDCDQILVLAQGEICEDGTPHQLLFNYFGDIKLPSAASDSPATSEKDEDSVDSAELLKNNVAGITPPKHSFASLVKQTGPEMCYRLRKLAKYAAVAAATTTATVVETDK